LPLRDARTRGNGDGKNGECAHAAHLLRPYNTAWFATYPGRVSRNRAALAGAIAASVWAALEPLDERLFGSDYSDVALLGKAVTRSRFWPVVGLAIHVGNGALFGLAFREVQERTCYEPRRLALALALAEHAALYPLNAVVDRKHPARGEPGVPPLLTSPRAFAQATYRHALFGVLLGRLAGS
jgi:hypothetical protein